MKKLTLAVVGCGEFARCFVPLFKAHPHVEKVYVCDLVRSRAEDYSARFGTEVIESFEQVLRSKEISAVAVFTDRHLHARMVKDALLAGKHVYSAVPMASSVEECLEIVEIVRRTGLVYMMGETCIYYPCSVFCKEGFEKGDFGRFVFGEAQYYHDISHFPLNYRSDKKNAGLPPFFYPTHSTAMLLHATGSYVTKVVAMGYEDREDDGIYRRGVNRWDNVFSNGYSLMKLENGGTIRINECRRIGYKAPSSYISGFYGTKGSYQFSNAQHIVTRLTKDGVDLRDVSAEVNPRAMEEHRGDADFKERVANHAWQGDSFSPQHDARAARLPESFRGLPNGHMASHQLLVDDFCTAVFDGTHPTVDAALAARYTIPGLLAHESILRDSEPVKVPVIELLK